MTTRISEKFRELKSKGEVALIPYIRAGDPDLNTTGELIAEIERSGADMIELGVPFSDPLADGPTIQRAAIRALSGKVNLGDVIKLVENTRKRSDIPIILMLYYNLVHKYGERRFVRDAVKAGVDGAIIPDLPPDEAKTLIAEAASAGLDLIFLLAPTSSPDRMRLVDRSSGGFIYYVSLTGVTGARDSLDAGIEAQVARIRKISKKPVCIGFGISGPEQARKVARWADGVIVGSAIVGLMERASGKAGMVREVGSFVRGMKDAVTTRE